MGLLSRLKALLGFGDDRPARRGNVDVTVEHEPSGATDTERAVEASPSEPESAAATETGGPAAEPESVEDEAVAEGAEPAQTGAAAEPVDTIKGIGPSYADELSRAGVETVGDLAAADADALGDETSLSPKRIAGWIEQAEARTR